MPLAYVGMCGCQVTQIIERCDEEKLERSNSRQDQQNPGNTPQQKQPKANQVRHAFFRLLLGL